MSDDEGVFDEVSVTAMEPLGNRLPMMFAFRRFIPPL